MTDDDTSIRISIETWNELKNRKERPNESFDDVIQDLLEQSGDESGNPNRTAADA